MKKLLEEFKQFIARGNVLDMAVGVVVASAFTAIVNAVVSGLLTPIIGLLLPDTTFAEWAPGGFAIGEVINAVITFFITAAAVFAIVKAVNAVSNLKKKPEEKPAAANCSPPASRNRPSRGNGISRTAKPLRCTRRQPQQQRNFPASAPYSPTGISNLSSIRINRRNSPSARRSFSATKTA